MLKDERTDNGPQPGGPADDGAGRPAAQRDAPADDAGASSADSAVEFALVRSISSDGGDMSGCGASASTPPVRHEQQAAHSGRVLANSVEHVESAANNGQLISSRLEPPPAKRARRAERDAGGEAPSDDDSNAGSTAPSNSVPQLVHAGRAASALAPWPRVRSCVPHLRKRPPLTRRETRRRRALRSHQWPTPPQRMAPTLSARITVM